MMYSIGLVIDKFCLAFIGVVKTHLCSKPISYFLYIGISRDQGLDMTV